MCCVFFARNQLGLLCFCYISISFSQGTTYMQLWSYPQACFSLQSQSVAICSPLLSCLALFSKDSLLSTMFVTQQLPFQQILVEGDQQNPWTAILNVEKNLRTNFSKKKKNLGKFISASVHVKLFLNLRIIPDRPESTGEAFILSRKMLREII